MSLGSQKLFDAKMLSVVEQIKADFEKSLELCDKGIIKFEEGDWSNFLITFKITDSKRTVSQQNGWV